MFSKFLFLYAVPFFLIGYFFGGMESHKFLMEAWRKDIEMWKRHMEFLEKL